MDIGSYIVPITQYFNTAQIYQVPQVNGTTSPYYNTYTVTVGNQTVLYPYQVFDMGTANAVSYGTTGYIYSETEEQRLEREQRNRDAAAKDKARRERAKTVL